MRIATLYSAWFFVLVAVPAAHGAETDPATPAAPKPIDADNLPPIEKVSGPSLDVGNL